MMPSKDREVSRPLSVDTLESNFGELSELILGRFVAKPTQIEVEGSPPQYPLFC